MRNKKGFLLGEFTLKTVIAVICIIFLIFLLVSMYNTFSGKTEIEHARADLKRIQEGINIALQTSQSYRFVFTEPKGWIITFFAQDGPSSCFGQPCVCFCEEKSAWQLRSTQIKKCASADICTPVPGEFSMEKDIELDGAREIIIEQKEGGLLLSAVN